MMTIEAAIRLAEGYEKLERDQQATRLPISLLAIIDGMSTLPRRKALLFFPGVAVTVRPRRNFRSVISMQSCPRECIRN